MPELCWVSPEMLQLKSSVLKFSRKQPSGTGRSHPFVITCLFGTQVPSAEAAASSTWYPKAIPAAWLGAHLSKLHLGAISRRSCQVPLQSPVGLCPSSCSTAAVRITCRFITFQHNLEKSIAVSILTEIYSSFCLEMGLFFSFLIE